MFFNNVIKLSILSVITQVLYYVSCASVRDYAADLGKNVTLPCTGLSKLTNAENVMWIFEGKGGKQIYSHTIKEDGGLILSSVSLNESGVYTCTVDTENVTDNKVISKTKLTVRTVPPPLVNMTVHLSTILGLIFWKVAGDGGHPIIDFTAQYRSTEIPENETELEEWRPISPNHISPNARQIDVYHLIPNSSYWFRVWATNSMGSSVPVEAIGYTLYSDVDAELRKHLLAGAKEFDTRIWLVAVAVVMTTLCVLTIGTCLLLYRECRAPNDCDRDRDVMELVPNIILNPGFADGPTADGRPPPPPLTSSSKYSQANGSIRPRKV